MDKTPPIHPIHPIHPIQQRSVSLSQVARDASSSGFKTVPEYSRAGKFNICDGRIWHHIVEGCKQHYGDDSDVHLGATCKKFKDREIDISFTTTWADFIKKFTEIGSYEELLKEGVPQEELDALIKKNKELEELLQQREEELVLLRESNSKSIEEAAIADDSHRIKNNESDRQIEELKAEIEKLEKKNQELLQCLQQKKEELDVQKELNSTVAQEAAIANTLHLSKNDESDRQIEELKKEIEILKQDYAQLEKKSQELGVCNKLLEGENQELEDVKELNANFAHQLKELNDKLEATEKSNTEDTLAIQTELIKANFDRRQIINIYNSLLGAILRLSRLTADEKQRFQNFYHEIHHDIPLNLIATELSRFSKLKQETDAKIDDEDINLGS